MRHAVTPKSGHDSIDDNDSQVAQEHETYSSARLAVLHQCKLLHPIVYDTLRACCLCSSNQLSKLRVAQLRLTCGYYNIDIEKSALHNFYLRSCKVLFLHKGNACDVFFYYFLLLYFIYIIVLYNRNPYSGPDMTREKKKKPISRPRSKYLSAVSCNRDCNALFRSLTVNQYCSRREC